MSLGPVSREQIRRSIGLSLAATLEFLIGESGRPSQERFRQLFVEKADRVMVAQTKMLRGVMPALDALREDGLTLCVVSTKYRYRIEAILDRHGARERFAAIVGGEDTTSHKPDPEGILRVLKSLGLRGAEAVYIGDHVVDAEAAKRAAVPFVGVLTGTTTEDEFRQFPHLGIVGGVSELPSLLAEFADWPPEEFSPNSAS